MENIKRKQGWSLTEMMVLISILFIFFLITIVLINKFYSSLKKKPITSDYVDYLSAQETETALEKAALKYIEVNYGYASILNVQRISKTQLEKDDFLNVKIHEDCDGYVIVKSNNDGYQAQAFISCNNYETPGYQIRYQTE